MKKPTLKEKKPLTLEQARNIENWSERIFAIAVCSSPNLEVFYETERYGNNEGVTTPDFFIRNKKRGKHASLIVVEVTGAKNLNGNRKRKQLRVMRKEMQKDHKMKYFQFPREVLERISVAKKIEKLPSVEKRLKRENPPRKQLTPEGQNRLAYRQKKKQAQTR